MVEEDVEGRLHAAGKVRRPVTMACAWCGIEVTVPPRGRVPQWCGTACRHRAWEQRRAAASGQSATEIVERIVTIEIPIIRTVTEYVQLPPATPRGPDLVPLMTELARQLDTGRIYPRDLPALTQNLELVIAAINRRIHTGHRS